MTEILQEAVLPHNLPFTVLLGFVLLYWVIALFGILDLEMLDGLMDGGSEADSNLEVESDSGSARDDLGGPLRSTLNFLNATDVPIIFVLSLLSLFVWAANMIGNHYFNPTHSGLVASVIALAAIVMSFVLTKISTNPLKPFARMLKTAEKQEPIIGRAGTVRSPLLDHQFGQVEVEAKGAPLLLNARISQEGSALSRGTAILVVAKEEDSDWYTVRSLEPHPEKNPNL